MKKMSRYLAVAAAMVLSAGFAHADVIDFEEPLTSQNSSAPFAPLLLDGSSFLQGSFFLSTYSVSGGGLVGALVSGATLEQCENVTCPSNNPSTFFTALNDGYLSLGRLDGKAFTVGSFAASFVGGSDISKLPAVSGYLALQGITAAGAPVTDYFQLAGPTNGALNFASYTTSGAFAATQFVNLFAYGYACNTAGSCTAFDSNRAEFALDDIQLNTVTAVPEPETWALMLMGLAGVGALSRRQRSAATRHIV